jgi:hypothetical protein
MNSVSLASVNKGVIYSLTHSGCYFGTPAVTAAFADAILEQTRHVQFFLEKTALSFSFTICDFLQLALFVHFLLDNLQNKQSNLSEKKEQK